MDNRLLNLEQAKVVVDQEEKLPSKFLKIFNNHFSFYQSYIYINKGTVVSMSVCLSVGVNLFPNTITTSVYSNLCIQVPGEKITAQGLV